MPIGKNIDEIFKSKLEGRTFEYNDAHWAAAQKMLNKRKKKFWLIGYVANSKLLGLALAGLCIFAAAYPLLFSSSNNALPNGHRHFAQINHDDLSGENQETTPKKNQTTFKNAQADDHFTKANKIDKNENEGRPNAAPKNEGNLDQGSPFDPANSSTPPLTLSDNSKKNTSANPKVSPGLNQLPNRTTKDSEPSNKNESLANQRSLTLSQIDNQNNNENPEIYAKAKGSEKLLSSTNPSFIDANQGAENGKSNSVELDLEEETNFISTRETQPFLASAPPTFESLNPISFPTKPSPRNGHIWTIGVNAHYNFNKRQLIDGRDATDSYIAERLASEQFHNSYGFGIQVSRLSQILNWQLGLDFGQYSESIHYTSQATFRTYKTRTVLLDRKYGEFGEPIYLFETQTDTIDSVVSYPQIAEHKQNTIQFFEIPVFVGYNLPLNSKRLILDVGIGASWQRAFGFSGYVINNKRNDLVSLDNFLNRNSLYAMYGFNCQYRIGRTWYAGISARYKTSIASFRFDEDFSLQQYQIRFSITKAIR